MKSELAKSALFVMQIVFITYVATTTAHYTKKLIAWTESK